MKISTVKQPASAAYRLVIALGIASWFITLNAQAATTFVSTTSELNSALSSVQAGDTIFLNDGNYSGSVGTITRNGTSSDRIHIKAVNRHGAVLTGSANIKLTSSSYIEVDGLKFTGSSVGVALNGCNNVRITNCHFALTQSGNQKWLTVTGSNSHDNRIDHNLFKNKQNIGVLLWVGGNSNDTQISQNDRIDHNTFKNVGPFTESNGGETIRIGSSTLSTLDAFTIIEDNYFESCDGDPEYVSLKACNITVKNNTFLDCAGTLTSRHGNFNTISGNRIFGTGKAGCGGIRLYGTDHKVFNNYVYGLPKYALQISAGNAEDPGDSLSAHWRVVRAEVCFNTFINNAEGITVGLGTNPLMPLDCEVANNLVTTNAGTCFTEYNAPVNMTYLGNIAYATGSGSVGITKTQGEIWVTNPQLQGSYNILKLASNSPAISAAVGTYADVSADMDGESRGSTKDVGADEYSPAIQPVYSMDHGGSVHSLGSTNTGIMSAVAFFKPVTIDLDSNLAYVDTSVSPSNFADYAMLISMNMSNRYFEVRNGSSYAKTNNLSWQQGETYRIRTEANFSTQTYSVYIQPQGDAEVQIADNYAFRTGSPTTNDFGKVCLIGGVDRDFLLSDYRTYLLYEPFDSTTTGNAPSAWTTSTAGGTVTVENVPDANDKSVKVTDTSTTASASLSKAFTTTTADVIVDFDIRASQTNQVGAFYLHDSSGNDAVTVIMDSTGKITTYVGSTKTDVQTYSANTWYYIQIIARAGTDKFDLYVDGVQKIANQNLRTPVANFSSVRLSPTSSSTGTWFINDVWVTK